jgi:Dehydrogenases with different specificities (related to short-chain alcohol dehydrogenases)
LKTAIVTASTKGIGLEIAKKLFTNDYKVYMSYYQDEKTAENVQKFVIGESNAIISKVNLSDYSKSMKYLEEILEQEKKGIDCIVFNAGGTLKADIGEIQYDEWKRCFDMNLNIPFFMLQRAAKYINREGRIVFMSSVMSIYEHSSSIAYGVSKAAINSLTAYLVKYFCGREITVNAVIVGFTNTSMIKRTPEHEERIKSKIALGRFAEPEEIAQVVWHIIQDSYINGSLIEVDGGYCYQ